jgi:biopolymer transport protein ExbD
MGEVSSEGGGGHKKGKGKPKGKKQSTHIDMTPMVDLAFLLLTFFMLATSFNKPKVMEIVMPDKAKDQKDVPELAKERAMTILLGEGDKIFYYFGLPDKSGAPQLERTDYSAEGLRKILTDRKKYAEPYKGLFCIIKPTAKSKYKNIVDIFDEMNIVQIKYYAVVDITPSEEDALKRF